MSDVQSNLNFILGEISGKLDQVIKNQDNQNEVFGESLLSHDKRIKSLEGSRFKMVGAAGMAGAIASATWHWVLGK